MNTTTTSIRQLIIAVAVLLLATTPLFSKPITQNDAEAAVIGWLRADSRPMGAVVGDQIAWTDAYVDASDTPVYYIVYLDPSGYVIVAADDLVEPIVGFVTGYSYYDCSLKNALGAMVGQDLARRVDVAKRVDDRLAGRLTGTALTQRELVNVAGSLRARVKWQNLDASVAPMGPAAPTASAPHASSVSDVRVAPLVTSQWGQDNVNGAYCYNYYTPSHFYDGCVATAMTQFMRYWQWPASGIGVTYSTISVSSVAQAASTRGGDGAGGPYNWAQMPIVPGASMTIAQRQAIGALCYDAGVAAHMQYGAYGSGAWMRDAKSALVTTFNYSSAVLGGTEASDIGANLKDMINPNLDSGNPVLLAIYQLANGQYGGGHAIVADGYGYNSTTMYHHLNLGWDGQADAWYNLPTIDTDYYTFNTVVACVYNIYMTGSGEIISGRLTNTSGTAVPGAVVTATGTGGPFTAISNDKGIYALTKVRPNATYTITVSAPGCTFSSQTVTTGLSADHQVTTGNRAGIDFVTSSTLPAAPAASASITYPATNTTGSYTVSWQAAVNAAAYKVTRSLDGGSSWVPVYSGTGTSFTDNVVEGRYRYRVMALSGGGSSAWTSRASDCVVGTIIPAAPTAISYPSASTTAMITVTWPAVAKATSYALQRSANGGASWTQVYSGANAAYNDTVASGSYKYAVKAVNSAGSSALMIGTTTCVVRIACPVPASITYPAVSPTGKYTVTWAASAGATSYVLNRSVNAGTSWTQVYSGAATSYSASVGEGTYYYSVKAVNAFGSSGFRTGTSCLVMTPPPTPAVITYPATSSTGFYTVTWTPSKCGTTVTVQRSSNSGVSWTTVWSGGGISFSDVITQAGGYMYRVCVSNAGGTSAWRTGTIKCTMVAPAAPASITYPASNTTGMPTISWPASGAGYSYTLSRTANNGTTWITVMSGSLLPTYTDNVLSGNYKYKVAVVGKFGTSTYTTGTVTCVVKRAQ